MDGSINSSFSQSGSPCRTENFGGVSWCSLRGLATVLFALGAITGQVTQIVSLPLWIDSAEITTTPNTTTTWKPSIDNYFVLSFSAFMFVVVFGGVLLIGDLICPNYFVTTEWMYRFLLVKVGLLQGLGALFIVFSSSGNRTAPYLQAILGNVSIPVTLVFRFALLKKIPTCRKLISAIVVTISLFVCLIPSIFPAVDPEKVKHLGGAKGVAGILWPLTFILGFVFAALGFIVEEKAVKIQRGSHAQAGLVSVLFWTSLSQFIVIALLFWTDFIPSFGQVRNIREFSKNWWFGLQCCSAGADCSSTPLVLTVLFITGYVLAVSSSALLLRYSEGATLLAIVLSLATPLGFIFWTLFQEKPFKWHPKIYVSSWFSIGALVFMIPAAFVYNTGEPERENLNPSEREQVSPLMYNTTEATAYPNGNGANSG